MKRFPHVNATAVTVASLVVVAVVLVVFAADHRLKPTGDVTFGDAVVGLGTILLALFTAQLARETYRIDQNAVEREQEERKQARRDAARLVVAQLLVITKTLEDAENRNAWQRTELLPTSGWERFDREILAGIHTEEDRDRLVRFFTTLDQWQADVRRVIDSEGGTSTMLSQTFGGTDALSGLQRLQLLQNEVGLIWRVLTQLA